MQVTRLVLLALPLLPGALAAAQTPRLLAVHSPLAAVGPNEILDLDDVDASATSLGVIGNASVSAIAWCPANERLYALDDYGARLLTLDPQSGAVQTSVTLPGGDLLVGLTVHPTTGELYSLRNLNEIVRVDSTTGVVTGVALLTPLIYGEGIAFSLDGTSLYVVHTPWGEVWRYDPTTGVGTLFTTLSSVGMPMTGTAAVHPSTGDLYVEGFMPSAPHARIVRVDGATGTPTVLGDVAGFDDIRGITFGPPRTFGTTYCGPAAANSTGAPAEISAIGSDVVASNGLVLEASSLPQGAFAFFLAGQVQDSVPNAGGSQGTLCLGNPIGRIIGPGQIVQANAAGEISVPIDLTAIPQPTGFVAVTPGETWNFQGWYRDAVGGAPTSNFTDGLSILFL